MAKYDIRINSTTNENRNESQADSPKKNDRGQWSSGIEFLLSCISMSVGLGNVWRFPYVAYENGGGAFLIPYLILLFIIGRPIYYMEMIIGQFSGRGPIKMWKCAPAFRGIAFAQLFSVSYVTIFYNYIMCISVYYCVASFSSPLPWSYCHEEWVPNGWCEQNQDETSFDNQTWPELYYTQTVLHQSNGLWDVNQIEWKLTICLFVTWTLVYLTIINGVTSLGKVSYFTAFFPYLVLISLLIVSMFQDGALDGIKYFFEPQFEKLKDPIVWYRAVEQSFFSLAICFGSLVMYSSYNDFTNNVNRDCIIISLLDTFTSVLAGCVTFAVLGSMAKESGKEIKDVVRNGPGLTFIAYPEGLAKIKFIPQLWSVLFFIMLLTLGIGSSVSMIETILSCTRDQFPRLHRHKPMTALIFCIIFFCFGLPLTTDAGSFIMQLLDNYGVGTAAFLYGTFEVIGIMWAYGLSNFCLDVQFMLGSRPSILWKITWGVLTPFVLIVIFIYGNVLIFRNKADVTDEMPEWGTGIGWALAGLALIQIPIWFIIQFFHESGTMIDRFRSMMSSTMDYGPIEKDTFDRWIEFVRNNRTKKSNSEVMIPCSVFVTKTTTLLSVRSISNETN